MSNGESGLIPERRVNQYSFGTKLVGERELAAVVGVPLATLKRMAAAGEIPGVKLGGRWRFNQEAVLTRLYEVAGSTYRASAKRGTLASQGEGEGKGEGEGEEEGGRWR